MAGIEELFKNVNITDVWRHNDRERGMVSEHRRSVRAARNYSTTRRSTSPVLPASTMISTSRASRDLCGTCHDSPNVGHHSVKAPLNIGVPDAGDKKPPVLDICRTAGVHADLHAGVACRPRLQSH